MKKILTIALFLGLALSAVWASDDGTPLHFIRASYTAWSQSRQCRVQRFIVWEVQTNPLTNITTEYTNAPQTIYVPVDICENKQELHRYLRAAFSFDGTPVPRPTHWIMPTPTPTVTATPDAA